MPEFASWRSYWTFSAAVRRRSRYVKDAEVEDFLATVLATSVGREEKLPSGTLLWRAQVGHDWEEVYIAEGETDQQPAPFPPDRMKPLPDRAKEGRTNPKGIPQLYLSTGRDIAIAEVRPWLGSLVSVAQFKVLKDVTTMNCTTEDGHRRRIHFQEPGPKERETAVWADIDRAFAQPLTIADDIADYVPTQILAELFKSRGFDGIGYRSAFGDGHNIGLFDLNCADLINCSLFRIKSVKLESSEESNPYFVSKYYDKGHG